MNLQMIATCPEETKELVAEEIKELGGQQIELGYRSVHFHCSEKVFYHLHLHSRLVSRFHRVIKQVPAQSPDILFDKASKLKWPSFFSAQKTFKIEGIQTERGPDLMPSNLIEKKVREGIVDSFTHHCGQAPRVDLQDPQVKVIAFWRKGRCMLSLDTTGKALHKRGYRLDGHPAPIKETLAAALCRYMGYDGMKPFWDGMCGSGTIAIEAAMMAIAKAPLIHRKKGEFAFENLEDFNKDLWRKEQDQTRADKLEDPWAKIYASDISERFIDAARENALRARVEKYMDISVKDFFESQPPHNEGYLVMNIPYGERIGEQESQNKEYFKKIGDHLKQNFSGWKVGLLVPTAAPHKFVGLRPSRKIPLMNGSIDCRLLIYEMYAGSKRT